jgi:superfamily I DNA and/or RNA helicase
MRKTRSQIPEASQSSVETIDSMQGREAKAIIFIFTI